MAATGRARHRLRLPVAGDRLLQRSPADAALRLPAERHPQPRRNRPGHTVVPLRRLLGHRGDGVRPARTAHRTDGDVRRRWSRPSAPSHARGSCQLGRPALGGGDRSVRRGAAAHRITRRQSKRIAAVGKRIAKYHEPAEAVVAAANWVRSELEYVPGHHRRALVGAGRATGRARASARTSRT